MVDNLKVLSEKPQKDFLFNFFLFSTLSVLCSVIWEGYSVRKGARQIERASEFQKGEKNSNSGNFLLDNQIAIKEKVKTSSTFDFE